MTNAADRVEIITSVQRRRRWTASEKVRIDKALRRLSLQRNYLPAAGQIFPARCLYGLCDLRGKLLEARHLFKSFAFSRTSSEVLRKKPATPSNDIPRLSASSKKNRSALAHDSPMFAKLEGAPFLAADGDLIARDISER
jgi:hypothetical protein